MSEIDSLQIQHVLNDALSWLGQKADTLDESLRNALSDRLLFRREFLAGLDLLDTSVMRRRSIAPFQESLRHICPIKKSKQLGKPIQESFSLKIQRRLASTVPPRPIVNISFDDAITHITRLCQDGIDVQEILQYRGPYNLQVCTIERFL